MNGSVVGSTKDDLAAAFGDALKERIDTTDFVLVESGTRNGQLLRE